VRADELPLVLPAAGMQGLPRGARVRVRLGDIDEITLDVHSTVIERLDAEPEDAALLEDDMEGGESELAAGPISIAVDMSEAEAEVAGAAPAV
jgi:exoribonuclease-2